MLVHLSTRPQRSHGCLCTFQSALGDGGDPGQPLVEDPVRFIRHEGLMLIDEVQRVPDLWLATKNLVGREPRAGRFLLT